MTSILIITRWKRNKGFDESRFSHYPLSWESAGMVERIKNLFSFNFIDAEERNASLHKKIKNWILVVFRTCIIHKLTASCLRLSFHLTFKFLVLQTNHQFFLFFVLKCKTKIQSGRSHADFSTLKSEDLTTKSWCVSLSIWTF